MESVGKEFEEKESVKWEKQHRHQCELKSVAGWTTTVTNASWKVLRKGVDHHCRQC